MKTKDLHLIAFYTIRPRDPKKTHVKGYMSNPANHQYDERIEFTRGLSSKDQQYAGVVLNLNQKTVVYNKYNAYNSEFDTLFKYFLEAYPKYVIQVMAQLDMPYLEQFIPKEESVAEEIKDAQEVSST